MTPVEDDELVTVAGLAKMFKRSPASIYRDVARPGFPVTRIGGTLRFRPSEVLAYWQELSTAPKQRTTVTGRKRRA